MRKIVSNLPYYITGPLLFQICEAAGDLELGVFMMQQEVARRLFAEPGSRDYGRMALNARLYAAMEHAFDVSRRCFTPVPRVKSSVVVFRFHRELEQLTDIPAAELSGFISICFSQRRKKLAPVLGRRSVLGHSREAWEEMFRNAGLPLLARPEELMLKDFIALAEAARKR